MLLPLRLFRVKLFIFIHMHRDGEDPNTNTSASALLWVEVEAHLHVVAGVDAGVLADRLAMPAQLVYSWRVLVSLGRIVSISGVIETSLPPLLEKILLTSTGWSS